MIPLNMIFKGGDSLEARSFQGGMPSECTVLAARTFGADLCRVGLVEGSSHLRACGSLLLFLWFLFLFRFLMNLHVFERRLASRVGGKIKFLENH